MPKNLSTNTLTALQNAGTNGIVVRYLLHIEAKNISTGAAEEVNIWTGELPLDIDAINPRTGNVVTRTYQAGANWMKIPSIPQSIELEARSLRLTFSRLPPAAINIIRAYNPKLQQVEIYRALFDPQTRAMVDPAYCLFSGFINQAPLTVPENGGEGDIELECSSYARYMSRPRGDKFSDECLKRRNAGDRFGRYLDVAGLWRVFWGEEDSHVGRGKTDRRERFK